MEKKPSLSRSFKILGTVLDQTLVNKHLLTKTMHLESNLSKEKPFRKKTITQNFIIPTCVLETTMSGTFLLLGPYLLCQLVCE